MKGFRFRLESVLKLRRHRLEQRRLELAQAQVKANHAKALATRTADALEQGNRELEKKMAEGLSGGELRDGQRGVEALAREAERAQEAAREAARAMDRAMDLALEARRDLRALETLREKALAEYRREMERRQQNELDEIGGQRAHRHRGDWA